MFLCFNARNVWSFFLYFALRSQLKACQCKLVYLSISGCLSQMNNPPQSEQLADNSSKTKCMMADTDLFRETKQNWSQQSPGVSFQLPPCTTTFFATSLIFEDRLCCFWLVLVGSLIRGWTPDALVADMGQMLIDGSSKRF